MVRGWLDDSMSVICCVGILRRQRLKCFSITGCHILDHIAISILHPYNQVHIVACDIEFLCQQKGVANGTESLARSWIAISRMSIPFDSIRRIATAPCVRTSHTSPMSPDPTRLNLTSGCMQTSPGTLSSAGATRQTNASASLVLSVTFSRRLDSQAVRNGASS
ncbi:hypothetical protein KC345_g325 [Hortaea werneckii]|nr:hypothetical protein KC345_g325 [Hortaea werneckii]